MKETATFGGIGGKKRIRLKERGLLIYIYFVFFGFWAMRVYNLIQKTELKFLKFKWMREHESSGREERGKSLSTTKGWLFIEKYIWRDSIEN